MLRIRRPDLPRAYKSPWFPLPQILSSVGILLGMWFITPPGMNPRDIYVPFGSMLGLTAIYALVWTMLVQKVNPFRPVPVEEVLEQALGLNPDTAHNLRESAPDESFKLAAKPL